MKNFLLVLVSIWMIGTSFAKGSNEPMPFNQNTLLVIDQDAPVYPNPAQDHIFLNLTDLTISDNSEPTIEIRNILGNKMPLQLERINRSKYRISLANYPSGYYLLVLQCDHCSATSNRLEKIHKFLKQ